jgi:Na+/citrate or Na+/malate symporter
MAANNIFVRTDGLISEMDMVQDDEDALALVVFGLEMITVLGLLGRFKDRINNAMSHVGGCTVFTTAMLFSIGSLKSLDVAKQKDLLTQNQILMLSPPALLISCILTVGLLYLLKPRTTPAVTDVERGDVPFADLASPPPFPRLR